MKKWIALLALSLLGGVACTSTEPIENLIVASEQIDCTGVAPQKCLLIKHSEEDSWEFWYEGIEGFDYEPGFEYQIRVRIHTLENPPADRSSIRYELVKVISKTPGPSKGIPGQ